MSVVSIGELKPDSENARRHGERNLKMIEDALREVGAARSVVIDEDGNILAGNATVAAAIRAGLQCVRIVDADGSEIIAVRRSGLTPTQKKRLALYDNRTAELSEWDTDVLARLVEADAATDVPDEKLLAGLFTDTELVVETRGRYSGQSASKPETALIDLEPLQQFWQVQAGQVWRAGDHYLICGDCRDPETWSRLMKAAGVSKVNGVFTSPPYAEQRKKQYGGIPAAKYVDWWEAVQANVKPHLAADGSFFVNIKAHCEDGERTLYVYDLVLAMKRRWGWRFVDEFCWYKSDDGVPGGWNNRFKNAWESIFHFCTERAIKFRPDTVSRFSESCFDYLPGRRKNRSGSGFTSVTYGLRPGLARPSNVIQMMPETRQPTHPAPFPVTLPDFFIRAFSDPGDVWVDPFAGSGTLAVAAQQAMGGSRRALLIEAMPVYCAVICERLKNLGLEPRLVSDGHATTV